MSDIPYQKNPAMIVRQADPFNAETPLDLLRAAWLTPTDLFYVRSHGGVPQIDPAAYRLKIRGLVEKEIALSLDEIRTQFSRASLTATLHCAGNRRDELRHLGEMPGEVTWGAGAIGAAFWTGAPLQEVLQSVGVDPRARHVEFVGLDDFHKGEVHTRFGGSIPLEKALGPEVLLAYEMNGDPLPQVHGAPLRLVVPGYIGARSVKWLEQINVQREPSDNYFSAQSYRLYPPALRSQEETAGVHGIRLGETSVNSIICQPIEGQSVSLRENRVTVRGLAFSGGGRRIERVDVSLDGGQTWLLASWEGEPPHDGWSWRFWIVEAPLNPGEHQIVARAWDSAANTQPEEKVWNFKGYMNNAWHRFRFNVE